MSKKILVLGASGFTGSAITRRLLCEGYSVRTIARTPEKALGLFGNSVEVVAGSAENPALLSQAIRDCHGVHLSLPWQIEHQVATHVVNALKEQGMQETKITYISGNTVIHENRWHKMADEKARTEALLEQSGLPHTIFKPAWFMDALSLLVNNGRATIFGNQTLAIPFVALSDFANLVFKDHRTGAAQGKTLIVEGTETYTIPDALQKYCDAFYPSLKVAIMPIWFGRLLGAFSRNAQLKDFVDLMAFFEKVSTVATTDESANVVRTQTTLTQWIENQRKAQ